MELGEGTELESFRTEVRAFVAAHAPRYRVRTGVRSPESAEQLAELLRWTADLYGAGLLGGSWPVAFGGKPDHDPLRDVVVMEEIARARAPQPASGSTLAAGALIAFGSPAQQARHLPRIRAGQELWCQLFSEPEAGSDLAALRTRAERHADGWRINGQKVWTTNAQWADYGYLLARTDPDAPLHRGITAFVLDMRSAGVQVRPLRELTGTADFNEVFFDDVVVPRDAVIGEPGQGWRVAGASLAEERIGVGASVVQLHLAWDDLAETARRLVVDGRPALEQRDVRQELAALRAEIDACTQLVHTSLLRWQAGSERAADAPMAKLMFSELNLRLAEYAVGLLGEAGILTEGDREAVSAGRWQDAYLYARAYTIAGGSSELMRNLIAERGLSLPREPRG